MAQSTSARMIPVPPGIIVKSASGAETFRARVVQDAKTGATTYHCPVCNHINVHPESFRTHARKSLERKPPHCLVRTETTATDVDTPIDEEKSEEVRHRRRGRSRKTPAAPTQEDDTDEKLIIKVPQHGQKRVRPADDSSLGSDTKRPRLEKKKEEEEAEPNGMTLLRDLVAQTMAIHAQRAQQYQENQGRRVVALRAEHRGESAQQRAKATQWQEARVALEGRMRDVDEQLAALERDRTLAVAQLKRDYDALEKERDTRFGGRDLTFEERMAKATLTATMDAVCTKLVACANKHAEKKDQLTGLRQQLEAEHRELLAKLQTPATPGPAEALENQLHRFRARQASFVSNVESVMTVLQQAFDQNKRLRFNTSEPKQQKAKKDEDDAVISEEILLDIGDDAMDVDQGV